MSNFIKSQHTEAKIGVGYALLAFVLWGFLPIYWKILDTVSSLEILAHRMVWSVVFLMLLLAVQKRLGEFRDLLKTPKYILIILGTALLLGVNWFVYIYGVNSNQIVETSLGYFINPLFNVLLGAIFLKERLNYWQSFSTWNGFFRRFEFYLGF